MKKVKDRKSKYGKSGGRSAPADLQAYSGGQYISNRTLDIFIFLVLLGLGIYESVVYFGHQVVPNPDFTGFTSIARRLVSFGLPGSYKRLPVLGLLQIAISSLFDGQHPDLTAGWLLNAVLHPFNIVLVWLIGRRLVGKSAVWVAVIAAINPWTLQMLTEPIVETTLLFFILLTFYFILRRSSWAYLFASVASMTRYEGAILIMLAFLLDMIYSENARKRVWAFVRASAASVPLGLWMLGTFLNWSTEGKGHYLKDLGARTGGKVVFLEFIDLTWRTGISPLFMLKPDAAKDSFNTLFALSKLITAASFTFGLIYGFIKRNWYVPAMFIFVLLYLIVHAFQASLIGRHGVAVYWIVLLICLYGFQNLWVLINKNNRIPTALIVSAQVIISILVVLWLAQLVPFLPKIKRVSPHSAYIPYVAACAVALIFILNRLAYRSRFCLRDVLVSSLVCLIIVSNQFTLVNVLRTGLRDVEFKMLADWYAQNIRGAGKLVSTQPGLLRTYAPKYKDQFVHIVSIDANSPIEFVEDCYKNDITYVTWSTRLGLKPNDMYYKRWRLENIVMLAEPKDIGPYEFVTKIQAGRWQYINVFRLKKPPPETAH
jgi:hypothetical protein